jgi:hypothetical protein
MDELINDTQAEWLVAIVSVAILFGAMGWFALARSSMRGRLGRRGTLAALATGPLIYLLWRLDALLIAWLGFDTLKRVGVEVAIFVALGLAIGLWLRGDARDSSA